MGGWRAAEAGPALRPPGPMIAQAAGLALLAALSPTALLVAAVYLGSARPRLTSLFYLAGAVAMSLVMGVVILGAVRKPRPPDPAKPQRGLVSRMVAEPAPLSAFVVGLLVFAPGVTFLAALQ